MSDLEKQIKTAEKKVAGFMKSDEWRKSVEASDKQLEKTLEKLRNDSKVDPRLLEEPATL